MMMSQIDSESSLRLVIFSYKTQIHKQISRKTCPETLQGQIYHDYTIHRNIQTFQMFDHEDGHQVAVITSNIKNELKE